MGNKKLNEIQKFEKWNSKEIEAKPISEILCKTWKNEKQIKNKKIQKIRKFCIWSKNNNNNIVTSKTTRYQDTHGQKNEIKQKQKQERKRKRKRKESGFITSDYVTK